MKTEWISVDEKLPEEGVLFQVKMGCSRVVEPLKHYGNIWYTVDDKLYCWIRPTHYEISPPQE